MGAIFVSLGVATLVFGVSRGMETGWTQPSVMVALALAAGVTAAPAAIGALAKAGALHGIDAWGPTPLVRIRVFRGPVVRTGFLAVVCLGMTITASTVLTSLRLEQALGYSALAAGACSTPETRPLV
jgi:hypothetical protein